MYAVLPAAPIDPPPNTAVSFDDVERSATVELTHTNLNDETVEGIKIKGKKAFTVQHHPEAAPGPHDSVYLFDQFVELLESNK